MTSSLRRIVNFAVKIGDSRDPTQTYPPDARVCTGLKLITAVETFSPMITEGIVARNLPSTKDVHRTSGELVRPEYSFETAQVMLYTDPAARLPDTLTMEMLKAGRGTIRERQYHMTY